MKAAVTVTTSDSEMSLLQALLQIGEMHADTVLGDAVLDVVKQETVGVIERARSCGGSDS